MHVLSTRELRCVETRYTATIEADRDAIASREIPAGFQRRATHVRTRDGVVAEVETLDVESPIGLALP